MGSHLHKHSEVDLEIGSLVHKIRLKFHKSGINNQLKIGRENGWSETLQFMVVLHKRNTKLQKLKTAIV